MLRLGPFSTHALKVALLSHNTIAFDINSWRCQVVSGCTLVVHISDVVAIVAMSQCIVARWSSRICLAAK